MAVLFTFEEQRHVGKANACQYVCFPFLPFFPKIVPDHFFSVRFAPPLVISEEDLKEAVKIIGECLLDLDQVKIDFFLFQICVLILFGSWMIFRVTGRARRATLTDLPFEFVFFCLVFDLLG